MKAKQLIIICLSLFVMGNSSLLAQNTAGQNFWITFGKLDNNPPGYFHLIDMQIRIVGGEQSSSGSIYFTNLGTFYYFDISPYQVIDYTLDIQEKEAVYNYQTGTTDYSIFITTSTPVTVYTFSHSLQLVDATNILPVSALGTDYYHISHYVHPTDDSDRDVYAVIATQDNTHLYHNSVYITTLNAGQVYSKFSDTDMSGAHITTNHPVALFALCTGVALPYGLVSNLMQQLAPVNTWGKTFFVPVTVFEKEYVRIVVSQNGTLITQTGGIITTFWGGQSLLTNLQAGEYVDLEINLINNGCFIESTKPVGVCSFIASDFYTGLNSSPSQAWIPGTEQTVSKAIIAPFIPNTPSGLWEHYALIVTNTVTKENTMFSIGGALPVPLSGGSGWYNNATAGMSFYSMPLTEISTSYIFSNPEGIIILGYATGNALYKSTYFYLAYSAMRDLDAAFYANDIHFQDLKENPICAGEVEFRAEIEGLHPTHPERIRWYINGIQEISAFNQVTWSRTFGSGEYEIRMWVRFENDDTISKYGTLTILSCATNAAFYANDVHHSDLQDTTFCSNDVFFLAEIEGLHVSLKWYINGIEEESARDRTEWSKTFPNGNYEIKMDVLFEDGEIESITSTVKILAPWIKIRNIRRD